MTALAPSNEAQGYLLLTLDQVTVTQVTTSAPPIPLASGELRLQCISIPIDPSIGHQRANPFADASDPSNDLWLVLEVGGEWATTLLPDMKVTVTRSEKGGVGFFIPGENGEGVRVEVKEAEGKEEKEDLETFEVLLRQYGCLPLSAVPEITGQTAIISDPPSLVSITNPNPSLLPTPPPLPPRRPGMEHSKSQGRLLLIDQTSGEVVGELSQQLSMEEDARLNEKGRENEVVVVDFGLIEDSGVAKFVTVKTIDEEDRDDWMLKGASILSKSILSISSFATTRITSAAEFYIAHSTPTTEPVVFSPGTKEGIRQVHNVSAKGLRVTKRTLGMVNNAIAKVITPIAETVAEAGYEAKSTIDPLSEKIKTRVNSFSQSTSPSASRRSSTVDGKSYEGTIPDDFKRDSLTGSAVSEEPEQEMEKEQKRKSSKGFFQRLIIASEVVLTSLEATTANLIDTGTNAAASAAEHKFGPDAGHATKLLGGSVRHVALVYVDVRGVGRAALLKSTAKGFVKTTLKTGKQVKLQAAAPGDEHAAVGGVGTLKTGDGEVVNGNLTVMLEDEGLVGGRGTALEGGGAGEKGVLTRRS